MKLGAGPQVGLLCSVLKAPEGVSAELERSAVLLLIKCPNSSMVEHTAVNRGGTGSSPVWGALKICLIFFMKMRYFYICDQCSSLRKREDEVDYIKLRTLSSVG